MPPKSKRNVIIYALKFKGLYGRNRKEKLYVGKNIITDKEISEAELNGFAQKELVDIGAKRGIATMMKWPKVEEQTYDENGKDIVIHSIPIFDAVPVFKLEV